MDNLEDNSLQDRKTNQKAKTMKKPMKVVYISNPMKFQISASQFMELVQELTGQNSELPADPSKFMDGHHVGDASQTAPDGSSKTDDDFDDHAKKVPALLDLGSNQQAPAQRRDVDDGGDAPLLDSPSVDDYFIPQILESFSTTTGFMYSSLIYESTTEDMDVPRK